MIIMLQIIILKSLLRDTTTIPDDSLLSDCFASCNNHIYQAINGYYSTWWVSSSHFFYDVDQESSLIVINEWLSRLFYYVSLYKPRPLSVLAFLSCYVIMRNEWQASWLSQRRPSNFSLVLLLFLLLRSTTRHAQIKCYDKNYYCLDNSTNEVQHVNCVIAIPFLSRSGIFSRASVGGGISTASEGHSLEFFRANFCPSKYHKSV